MPRLQNRHDLSCDTPCCGMQERGGFRSHLRQLACVPLPPRRTALHGLTRLVAALHIRKSFHSFFFLHFLVARACDGSRFHLVLLSLERELLWYLEALDARGNSHHKIIERFYTRLRRARKPFCRHLECKPLHHPDFVGALVAAYHLAHTRKHQHAPLRAVTSGISNEHKLEISNDHGVFRAHQGGCGRGLDGQQLGIHLRLQLSSSDMIHTPLCLVNGIDMHTRSLALRTA
mmetsp:Transcript_76138/g.123695  ORF Transcript_76138/g.123695 Transcript_76138/m.123695 type:complete len:232 (-) Transcript_76138:1130-1825(-)